MAAECSLEELQPIIDKHRAKPGNLIPVLHEVQNKVGYLPLYVQEFVARELQVPLSQVYGVATFYSLFSTVPRGQHTVSLCMGTACFVKGAREILARLEDELGIKMGETTEDRQFTLTVTRCLGACSMAPVMMVDEKVYGNVAPGKLKRILRGYQKSTPDQGDK
jgi:NADH-quinone oxidoreductase subunit E/NADP-reducing hydrogenase subunit HndA